MIVDISLAAIVAKKILVSTKAIISRVFNKIRDNSNFDALPYNKLVAQQQLNYQRSPIDSQLCHQNVTHLL
jgi:hypothetical protein